MATTVCNCEERATCKVLFLALAYKKCDIKTIKCGKRNKTKDRGFCLFAKTGFCFVWDFIRFDWFSQRACEERASEAF